MRKTNKLKNIYGSILAMTLIATAFQGFISSETVHAEENKIPGMSSNGQLQKGEVLIGETVKGTIQTPIQWGDNFLSSETTSTITLDEPLLFSDGQSIALPKNTSLIVQVTAWDDGFVTLSPVALKYKDTEGEWIRLNIPEDKNPLLIRNEDNQPLAFETTESNNNSLLGDIVSDTIQEAVQEGSRRIPVPGRIGSRVGRTIRNRSRRSRTRSNRVEFHSVEADTKVTVYVNNILRFDIHNN